MNVRQLAAFLTAFALFLATCKKGPTGPDTSSHTGSTQSNVSWPGLANSPCSIRLYDPQHTGRSAFRGPQQGRVGWRYEVMSSNTPTDIFASPVLNIDGTVLFGTLGGDLIALNPDGSKQWQVFPGGSDGSQVLARDGTIYTCTYYPGPPTLYAHASTGALLWSYPLTDTIGIAPFTPTIARDGQTVFVACGLLYAFSIDGRLRWKMRPDELEILGHFPTLSPSGTTLYVTGDRALYAVDTSGHVKWSFPQVTSEPSADNAGNLYFTVGNRDLYSLTPEGTVRWHLTGLPENGGRVTGPVIGYDGTIYYTGEALVAVSNQGSFLWKLQLPTFTFSQCVPAIDNEGILYLGRGTAPPSDTLNFMAVRPDGTIKFQVALRAPDGRLPDVDSSPAIGTNGRIYVGSDRPTSRYFFEVQ